IVMPSFICTYRVPKVLAKTISGEVALEFFALAEQALDVNERSPLHGITLTHGGSHGATMAQPRYDLCQRIWLGSIPAEVVHLQFSVQTLGSIFCTSQSIRSRSRSSTAYAKGLSRACFSVHP